MKNVIIHILKKLIQDIVEYVNQTLFLQIYYECFVLKRSYYEDYGHSLILNYSYLQMYKCHQFFKFIKCCTEML